MDGILNIYKEAGFTSHDVVAKLRGILHQKKIGHTGTLDPAAVGVLPVCCGKATKVCELLTDQDKTYRAVCRLGVETDTQDMTGSVLERHDIQNVTEEMIRETVEDFLGDSEQIPPMYSALKVGGKKLYELAREGKTVERKPRPIHISQIRILEINLEEGIFSFEVTCSKGTYIRTLCHDIGQKLGTGAAMEHLTRTRVSVFRIEDAMTLDEVAYLLQSGPEGLEQKVRQVDSLFPFYTRMQIRSEYAAKLSNGNRLERSHLRLLDAAEDKHREQILVYDEQGKFKAIYEKDQKDYKVKKMF